MTSEDFTATPTKKPQRLYQAYIFDLDGTIYLGDELLQGAADTIGYLRRNGSKSLFVSNNPTRSATTYAAKLSRLGLPTTLWEVINSTQVMVQFLRRELPAGRLFVIGEDPLLEELRSAGFELTEDIGRIDAVIASFDRTLVYRKLQLAFDAIRLGARFFATNADPFCPVPGGGEPDAGAIIAALEACTGRRVEAVDGKPSEHMISTVLERLKQPAAACLLIGDRLESDIQMGMNAGMDTALMLTGATSLDRLKASGLNPTYVLKQLGDAS